MTIRNERVLRNRQVMHINQWVEYPRSEPARRACPLAVAQAVQLIGDVIKWAIVVIAVLAAGAGWFAFGRDSQADQKTVNPPIAAGASDETVKITQADLNGQLKPQLLGQSLGTTPLGQATLRDIALQLTNGQMLANGQADVGGRTVPVTMTATSGAENGRAMVTVTDLRAAGVPLPGSTRDSLQQAIQSRVDAQVARLNLRVKGVSIVEGALLFVGTRR